VCSIELCKLLHLAGISSLQMSATIMLVLSFTVPLICHYNANAADDDAANADFDAIFIPASALQLLNYVVGSAATVLWAWRHLASSVFVYLTQREPKPLQLVTGSVAVYCGYIMVLLVLLKHENTRLRRYGKGLWLLFNICSLVVSCVALCYLPS
jgi:hypothetical protein